MSVKYSVNWLKNEIHTKGALRLLHHACSLCGVMTFYSFEDVDEGNIAVFFHPACGCSYERPRPSSLTEISDWLSMQKDDEIRDRIWSRLVVK